MQAYRCYLMSGESIHGVQILECAGDTEIVVQAAALLADHPEHQKIEVWDGARLVARVPRQPKSDV